jgi:hypothetical protein
MKKTLKKVGIIYLVLCIISYVTWIVTLITDSESLGRYIEFSMTYTTNLYKRLVAFIKKIVSFFYGKQEVISND